MAAASPAGLRIYSKSANAPQLIDKGAWMSEHDLTIDSKRLKAHEIFEQATETARDELKRSARALACSGVAGGLTMGLTAIAVASTRALLGDAGPLRFVPMLFYPIGFIAVIIGRAQLFTENTLYPVILVLDEREHVVTTLRLWAIVFASNLLGAYIFSLLATQTGALHGDIAHELVALGTEAVGRSFAQVFWSGVIGGWLIALVAWMVSASHWTIGQLAMVWLLTFVVGAGRFAHCIATSCEILSAVVAGPLGPGTFFSWLLPATLGNIVGGVFIVSLLNYGQVK